MAKGSFCRALPDELHELGDLARDLRWVGSHLAGRIWSRLDAEAWERTGNPYLILLNAHQDRLEQAAGDESLRERLIRWMDRRREYQEGPGWFGRAHAERVKRIAYFSMEFGLSEGLPIYSGGLGILAGDHLKSASDLAVPLVGVGLLYQQGYFRQVLADDGWQLEALPYNEPGSLPVTRALDADGRWPRIRVPLPGRQLLLRAWEARVGRVKLYLLDSNDPLNSPWDRAITANLYAAGRETRLLQELVLGMGGWYLLEKLGLDVDVCHLNEGHAAFAVLARAHSFAQAHGVPFWVALRATRAGNVFTTHTPVDAAFDKFEPDLLVKYALPFLEEAGMQPDELLAMGRRNRSDDTEPFNMAYLALRGCSRVNGVSSLHGEVSRRLFADLYPGRPAAEVPVGSITNGVHVPTWDSVPANRLWKKIYTRGRWLQNLEEACDAISGASDEDIWEFRGESRGLLVAYVRRRLQRQVRERGRGESAIRRAAHILDPNALTLGFAHRFTEYKRPNLLLHDPERLKRILLDHDRPVQLIVAGKAHPNDDHGKSMVQAVARFAASTEIAGRMVFLQDYDMKLAQELAGGIDVWINTPRRPAEACGTSGMKMLANGGLNLSTLDGWWAEAYRPEVGWAIGDGQDRGPEGDAADAGQLYDLLEQSIVPEFYDRDESGIPRSWVRRVRASMAQLTSRFSSDRMVREYVESVYLPAAGAVGRRCQEAAGLAADLESWFWRLSESWNSARIGAVRMHPNGDDAWHVEVEAFLGDLDPGDVQVELYADGHDGAGEVWTMEAAGPIPGAVNGYRFTAARPAARPADHYTPRIVPRHPEMLVPLEASHITWG